METQHPDFETLRELEESLWRSETRFDRAYMNKVLAPDFFEFGRSGNRYSREEILDMPTEELQVEFPLPDFQVHSIDTNVVLVSYISKVQYEELEVANRSSIWSKIDGEWKLRFHQGTASKSKTLESINIKKSLK